jgi:hypothetical protein
MPKKWHPQKYIKKHQEKSIRDLITYRQGVPLFWPFHSTPLPSSINKNN